MTKDFLSFAHFCYIYVVYIPLKNSYNFINNYAVIRGYGVRTCVHVREKHQNTF